MTILIREEKPMRAPVRERDLALAREYSRRLRERLGENLLSVTLYGSRARGDARVGSDEMRDTIAGRGGPK